MQAGFVVLRKTTMPSALIEVGYLSNPTEEKYLGSEAGQIQLAASIVEAFRQYKTAIEGRSAPNIDRPAPSPTTQQTTAPSNLPVAAQSTDPIVWYVQLASSEIPLSIREGVWLNVPKLISEKVEKHHVYLTGPHEKYESALDGQEYWQRNGFPDALLVPYSNGRRISWEEANRKP
jgi:N-acetylmuramoyl-L-alanine amidase